jgi:GAF domain-containing protein
MADSPIHFLQDQVVQLQKENQALRKDVATMRRYIAALADLYWMNGQIGIEPDPIQWLESSFLNLINVIGAKDGSVSRMDALTEELMFVIVLGELRHQLRGHRIKSDAGIAGWALAHAESVIVNNPRQDWRFYGRVDEEFAFRTRSILCVPMILHGSSIGVVQVLNKKVDFSESDMTLVQVFSHLAAQVLTTSNTTGA